MVHVKTQAIVSVLLPLISKFVYICQGRAWWGVLYNAGWAIFAYIDKCQNYFFIFIIYLQPVLAYEVIEYQEDDTWQATGKMIQQCIFLTKSHECIVYSAIPHKTAMSMQFFQPTYDL